MKYSPFIAALLLATGACAAGPKGPRADFDIADAGPASAPSEEEASRIIAFARALREEKGCAAAVPTYRVVAAMGAGLEAAQHELGECLIAIEGASPAETALYKQEALFWLTRAAYAGNARAQRALAVYYGAGDNPDRSEKEALRWALVYQANGEADLYGYKALPPTFAPGLRSALSAAEVADAEAFAKTFSAIRMAAYKSPPRVKARSSGEAAEAGPPGGGRRPPR